MEQLHNVHNPNASLDYDAELWVIGDRYVWGNNTDGALVDEIIDESADESNTWRPFAWAIVTPEKMQEFFEEAKAEYIEEEELDLGDWSQADDEHVWERVMSDGISTTGQGTDYLDDELYQVERRFLWGPKEGLRGSVNEFYDAITQTLDAVYEELAERVAAHRPDDEPLETRELPSWVKTFVVSPQTIGMHDREEGLRHILELEDETGFMILNDSDLPPWEWRGSYMGGAPSDQIWGAFFREEDGVFYFVSSASDPDTYAQMVELAASFDAVV